MSRTAISFLVNYGYFPKGTPEADVRRQVEEYLSANGVRNSEFATIWEAIGEGAALHMTQPIGAHLRAVTERKPVLLRLKTEPDFEPMEIAMLSPAAKRHFKIFRDPFQDDVNSAEDVFLSEDQRYILEAMIQTAKAGGITAVIGESGSGKSTLRQAATASHRA